MPEGGGDEKQRERERETDVKGATSRAAPIRWPFSLYITCLVVCLKTSHDSVSSFSAKRKKGGGQRKPEKRKPKKKKEKRKGEKGEKEKKNPEGREREAIMIWKGK